MNNTPWYRRFCLFSILALIFAATTVTALAQDDNEDYEDEEGDEATAEASDVRSADERCSQFIQEELLAIKNKWTEEYTLKVLHAFAFKQGKWSKKPFPDYSILRDMDWSRLSQKNATGTVLIVANWEKGDPKPEDSLENILKRTEEECKARLDEDFKMEERIDALYKEIDQRFVLHKPGDHVTVTMNKGKKITQTMENVVFKGCAAEHIILNDKYINRIDLDKETEASFDPKLNQEIREKYKAEEMARLQREYQSELDIRIRRRLPEAYKEAGWIPNILDKAADANWNNPHAEKWTTISALTKKFQQLKAKNDLETNLVNRVKARMSNESEHFMMDTRKNDQDGSSELSAAPASVIVVRLNNRNMLLCDDSLERADAPGTHAGFFAVNDDTMPYKKRRVVWRTEEEYRTIQDSGSNDD